MFARVNTFLGSPNRFEDDLDDVRDNVVPRMEKIDGFQGLMVLNDRATGRSIAITFWQNEGKLRASEEAAAQVRHENPTNAGSTVLSVERYEVALDTVR